MPRLLSSYDDGTWVALLLQDIDGHQPALPWQAAELGRVIAAIRADNLLLTEHRVWVVDWPWGCTGASWVDGANFAPSVEMQGGPSAPDVFVGQWH